MTSLRIRDRSRRRRAILALVVLTVLWGSTFTVTEVLCLQIDRHRAVALVEGWHWERLPDGAPRFLPHADSTPLVYSVARFGLVTALFGLALVRRLRRTLTRRALVYGLALGAIAGLGMVLQTYGLQRTTPSVSAFLTALNVPFTALLMWWVWRSPPSWPLAAGIALAFVGVGVIGLGPADATAAVRNELPFLGESLTVLCAWLFAWHTILIDRYTRREDALALTWAMFLGMTLVSVMPLPLFAGGEALTDATFWRAVTADSVLLGNLAYIVVFPTLLGFVLMMVYQREIEPAQAALVYALEPVHATWFSVGFGRESLVWWKVLGGALIVVGNVLAEWRRRPPPEPAADSNRRRVANQDSAPPT